MQKVNSSRVFSQSFKFLAREKYLLKEDTRTRNFVDTSSKHTHINIGILSQLGVVTVGPRDVVLQSEGLGVLLPPGGHGHDPVLVPGQHAHHGVGEVVGDEAGAGDAPAEGGGARHQVS